MVIQLVPSDWIIANLPAVAARIAVPAVLDPNGMTFDEAEVTAIAVTLFKYRMRPVKLAAAGRVTVQAVVVNRNDTSVVATVSVAALVKLGARKAIEPLTSNVVVAVRPIPTLPALSIRIRSVGETDPLADV